MPAVNSKPENGTTQLTKKQKSALQQLRNLVFLNLFSWLMMIPARPEMVLRITNNNPVQTSQNSFAPIFNNFPLLKLINR